MTRPRPGSSTGCVLDPGFGSRARVPGSSPGPGSGRVTGDDQGFKKMYAAIGREGRGVAPNFKHYVVLWEEIEHYYRKWKQRIVLACAKGHPERDATRESWTLVDWMNHVADRAADAEYGRPGGEEFPVCLRHQGRWRLGMERQAGYSGD